MVTANLDAAAEAINRMVMRDLDACTEKDVARAAFDAVDPRLKLLTPETTQAMLDSYVGWDQ